jgi:hypothetical protein
VQIYKVTIQAFFREHLGAPMECPGEQPLLFLTINGHKLEGIAIAWLPEEEPFGSDIKDIGDLSPHGSAWFGPASLIISHGTLASAKCVG